SHVGIHARRERRRRGHRLSATPQAVHDAPVGARAVIRVPTRFRGADTMTRPRVLIVDDDEQICFVATRALEAIAYCDSAHDVPQALRALNRNAYDVVLVDVTLPGPSGMTLLDELRRQWPQTAAIVLSGLTDLSVAREASSRGALGYVVKPFRVRDLRIQVTAALGGTQRSANAAWASARAQIVSTLDGLLGKGDQIAC